MRFVLSNHYNLAFSPPWNSDNDWLVPPIPLIGKTIAKIEREMAVATLVIPYWPSAYYWPLLFENGKLKSFFVEIIKYAKPKYFYEGYSRMFRNFKSDVWVCKIRFSET